MKFVRGMSYAGSMKTSNTQSRRTFIKTAAAAIAMPTIIPSSALGADGHTAPSERTVIGCIGVGGQGSSNMRAFLLQKDAQVVAVCDVDANHRAAAAKTVNETYTNEDCKTYTDFQEVIARDDIDALSIGTPDHWHAVPVIMGARAGKHLYCEKPLSLTIEEGQAMVRAVEEAGITFQTGTWRRSRPACRRACELVQNGYIGELKTMRIGLPEGFAIRRGDYAGPQAEAPVPAELDYEMWLGPAPFAPYTPGRVHFNFRWLMDYSEGYISDWGAHYYDIAQWANDSDGDAPIHIEGNAEYPPDDHLYDAPIKSNIVFTYKNGVQMISETTLDNKRWGMHFEGTEGKLSVESNGIISDPAPLADLELKASDKRLYTSDDHHGNFLACIRSGERTAAPVDIAHSSTSLCHLGMIACLREKPLAWDNERQQFDDAIANALRSRPMRGPWSLDPSA